jgi:SAM-dependent methyltransferase
VADWQHARTALRSAVVWDVLDAALAELRGHGGRRVTALDVGGGTGGFAVPLAEQGCDVTVVDPSPDSLAALQRRAAEAGVPAIRAVQGDVTDLVGLVGAPYDLVVCHSVLEVVDDPAVALAAVAAVLAPEGVASVLVAGRAAAAVARAAAGHVADARRVLESADGRWGAGDPLLRRFTPDGLAALLGAAGLVARAWHGVRVVADLVPAGLVEGDAGAAADLLALERAFGGRAEFLPLAGAIHVLAARG